MCEMTDNKEYVSANLFSGGIMANKRYTYVKLYEGAANVLDEMDNWRAKTLTVEQIVGEWSGGIDVAV
jgi:tryptophan 2,3-dioxygenase